MAVTRSKKALASPARSLSPKKKATKVVKSATPTNKAPTSPASKVTKPVAKRSPKKATFANPPATSSLDKPLWQIVAERHPDFSSHPKPRITRSAAQKSPKKATFADPPSTSSSDKPLRQVVAERAKRLAASEGEQLFGLVPSPPHYDYGLDNWAHPQGEWANSLFEKFEPPPGDYVIHDRLRASLNRFLVYNLLPHPYISSYIKERLGAVLIQLVDTHQQDYPDFEAKLLRKLGTIKAPGTPLKDFLNLLPLRLQIQSSINRISGAPPGWTGARSGSKSTQSSKSRASGTSAPYDWLNPPTGFPSWLTTSPASRRIQRNLGQKGKQRIPQTASPAVQPFYQVSTTGYQPPNTFWPPSNKLNNEVIHAPALAYGSGYEPYPASRGRQSTVHDIAGGPVCSRSPYAPESPGCARSPYAPDSPEYQACRSPEPYYDLSAHNCPGYQAYPDEFDVQEEVRSGRAIAMAPRGGFPPRDDSDEFDVQEEVRAGRAIAMAPREGFPPRDDSDEFDVQEEVRSGRAIVMLPREGFPSRDDFDRREELRSGRAGAMLPREGFPPRGLKRRAGVTKKKAPAKKAAKKTRATRAAGKVGRPRTRSFQPYFEDGSEA
ncbi:hypothetical protein BT63DRAFT_416357 [Microthyrium microscopicum]|uniref:Uncharacterized protein n=1 Tax=Microthyrium microscopicum TaxID=703497 RepID=A0A6A6U3T3_9PEZI|nr:hypothetical protein BT63DRAFT_416357 [Microthyrium microscopicum]